MATLIGQGPDLTGQHTTDVHTTPYPHKVGTRARDGAGNEYIFLDFNNIVDGGLLVQIDSDFSASWTGIVGRGPCGVACTRGTTVQAGWVQIYGRCRMQIADGSQTDGVSPSNGAPLTTLATTIPTMFMLPTTGATTPPAPVIWDNTTNPSLLSGIFVEGIVVATDTTITDVSDPSHTTAGTAPYVAATGASVTVFLNYPRIEHHNYGE